MIRMIMIILNLKKGTERSLQTVLNNNSLIYNKSMIRMIRMIMIIFNNNGAERSLQTVLNNNNLICNKRMIRMIRIILNLKNGAERSLQTVLNKNSLMFYILKCSITDYEYILLSYFLLFSDVFSILRDANRSSMARGVSSAARHFYKIFI